MDRNGSNPTPLTNGRDPAFSPDGRWIVFSTQFTLKLIHPDGSNLQRLGEEEGFPTFFPSGKRIVAGLPKKGIFTIRLDGTHVHRLTQNRDRRPDVSPSGKRIVFERRAPGGHSAVRVRLSHARRWHPHEQRLATGFDPAFSPNGKRIVFARYRSPRTLQDKVMVMNADGTDKHSVTPNPLPFGVADPSELQLGGPSWGPAP